MKSGMAVHAYNLNKGKEDCRRFQTCMSHRVKPCLKSKEDRSDKSNQTHPFCLSQTETGHE